MNAARNRTLKFFWQLGLSVWIESDLCRELHGNSNKKCNYEKCAKCKCKVNYYSIAHLYYTTEGKEYRSIELQPSLSASVWCINVLFTNLQMRTVGWIKVCVGVR